MGSISTRTFVFAAKKTRKITLPIAIFASLAGGAGNAKPEHSKPAAPAGLREVSHCAPEEVVLASCSIGRKLVSVCGRNNRSTYRYGRPGRIEFTLTNLHHAHRMFAGGGENQITATSGAYRYVIYDSAVRRGFDREGHNPLAFTSGLMVLRNGRNLANKFCEPMDSDIIDTNSVPNFMPKGEYIGH